MRKFDQQNSGRFTSDSGYDFGPLSRGVTAMERNAPDTYFLPPEQPGPVISGVEPVTSSLAIEPIDPTPLAVPPTISLTAGVAYTQNFDTLSNTAGSTTNNLLIDGWAMTEAGGGARDNEQYAVDTGGSNTGDTFSYGLAGATDRALGSIQSGTLIPIYGAAFTNDSGATITSLLISYVGEQWRISNTAAARDDRLDFQISFDATSLTTGTWTDVNELDFTNVIKTAATAGALNGNLDANKIAISHTLAGLNIPAGATFWIRWNDLNSSGADDGLAIDDFSITASTGVALPTLSINDVSQLEGNAGTTTFTFTVLLSAPAPAGGVTFDIATADGTATSASGDYVAQSLTGQTIPEGSTSYTFNVTVNGDVTFEPNETFFVNITNATGATIADGQGLGTISNDDAPPPVPGTLSINDVTLAEGNAGTTNFVFTVTRSVGDDGAVGATYTINLPGGAGGADATDIPGTLTGMVSFADGETSQTITVAVAGDTDFEPDETFTVTLSAPTGGATLGDAVGQGTITNDDAPPVPAGSVSIADATIVEGDAGTQILVLTLTRTGGTTAFDVNYATSNGGTPGNAVATAGSDYVASSGTVSFADGVNTATIQITINGDTTPELDEEFTVTLSGATNGATISDATAIATIISDDPQPTSVRIFEEDFTGFNAAGFAPNPTAAQLDSDIWRVVGLSDNPDPAYGLTLTTGDFARGPVGNSDPVTAGVYSPTANPGLLLQATGAELEANGFVEARIANTSGSTVTGFDIAFDWTYRNTGNRESNLQLAYSTDGVNFTAVPAAAFTTPAVGASTNYTLLTQPVSVSLTGLSVAADGFIYLRWVHANSAGSGNRDEFGIDNVTVDATGGATGPLVAVSDVTVNEADGTMTFTVTRTNANAGAFTVDYATANGTATAGVDYAATSGTLSFAANQVSQTVTVTINDDATPELDETVFLNLSNATGGAIIADGQGVGTIVNDDGTPIQVSISDASIVEGDNGVSVMTFTVTRTGGMGQFSFDYQTVDGTATSSGLDPNRDFVNTSGTNFTMLAGETTRTISIDIFGDTNPEPNENFTVVLSNATNDAVIVDGTGVGTIVNDEPIFIHEIQGSAYFSPILLNDGINNFNIASTTLVKVQAVITAVDVDGSRTGFYITEENSDWDASLGTSEGIFVMFTDDSGAATLGAGASTPGLGTFQVGDLVTVTARVMEYQSFSNMPVTVLTLATVITRDATNQPVPTLTLDSNHPMPNGILTAVTPDYRDGSDDVGDTFDYSLYALSYFETIESMLVTIPNMRAADGFVTTSGGNPVFQAYSEDHANPGQINSRGGYTISGDPALSTPDTPTITDDVRYGGRIVHDGDTNPDIIELDFTDFAMTAPAGIGNVTMGDYIGNVTGIIGFDFTDRKLYVTDIDGYDVNVINGNTPAVEVAEFSAADDPRQLTIATFNVENLTPGDGQAKFDALAQAILINLKLPDILSIEEIQDNNGETNTGGADATQTWTMLVNALNAAALAAGSDAVYQWVDQEPTVGAEGGAPGANIRVGFLYNTSRVQLGDLTADASIEDRRKYTDRLGDGVRDAGDLIQFDDSMIGGINPTDYTTTRKSLLGQFTFNGQTVFVLANHLPAKSGSGSFWQFNQNLESGQPANSDWAQRNAIGEDIYTLANYIQQNAPNAGFVAGGDFNDFQFTRALEAATGYVRADGTARNDGARLLNMTLTLDEAERYTYTFDGRSQAIDHILVNSLLAQGATYDIVHLNTGYGQGSAIPLSDHDPAVVRLDMRRFDEILNGTSGDDYFDVSQGGNDTVFGGDGNDGFYFGGAYTSADVVDGGAGRDQLGLQGDYSAGVTLGSLSGVEMIVLLAGDDTRFGDSGGNSYSYNIVSPDAAVAAGQRLTIQANTLRAGENLTFDGSAETDGSFLIYAGLGVDILTGGAGNDGFFFGQGRFGANDIVNGGAGTMDQLGLQGDFSGPNGIVFGANQLVGIEYIVLLSASDDRFGSLGGFVAYDLTMDDGNVAAGERMIISATTLTPSESIYFDGSAETDGSFAVYSGGCHDFILGSQNADLIYGGGGDDVIIGNGGADILYGGTGASTFGYLEASDSTDAARDQIRDFKMGDVIDLSILAFNNGVATFTFIGNDPQSGAQQIQVIQTGNNATVNIFIDGDAIADLVIDVTVADGHTLTEDDFSNTVVPQTPLKTSVETGAPDEALVMREFVEPGVLKLGFDEKEAAPDRGAGYGLLINSELYDGHPIDFVSLPETLYIGPASGDLLL